ncbi:hypothetical protein [Streptomyces pratensis]|uniref:hypothetical protein n=1 Tax=Streptomyces pratensis TaxID=1169025 RepID=UPI001EE440CB|nr:hypothetical protein [Streptomyces pratensis]
MSHEVGSTLQIYEVEYGDDHGGVCVVRCLSGVVRTGQLFLSPTATLGPAPAATLTTTKIECYGREVPFLDPPHTARVTLSGGPVTGLTRGTVLTAALRPTGPPVSTQLVNDQEADAVVTAVASVGSSVEVAGAAVAGFVDQVKHTSWWSEEVPAPQVGDQLHVVVLDDSRDPVRLSTLRSDIEIARTSRSRRRAT